MPGLRRRACVGAALGLDFRHLRKHPRSRRRTDRRQRHGFTDGQRRRAQLRRRRRDAPALVPARRAADDGHQVRLRHGAVRRLHRAPGRRRGALVQHADERRRRQEGHHHRRARRQGPASAAGGLARAGRAAVRLLPVGADHAGGGAAGNEEEAHRRRRSRPRCPATSAAAAPTPASRPPSSRPPASRRHDMDTNCSTATVAPPLHRHHRRRRRRLLAGARLARGRLGAEGAAQVRRLRHAQRRGREPAGLRLHRRRRHRHHHLPPRRDGSGRAHRRADDPGRRAGSRLGQGARGAGAGRRGALRQPGHRRLAHHAPLLHADAPLRRRGAADARERGGRALGRAGVRGAGEEPSADPQAQRPHASASAKWRADAAKLPVPAERRAASEEAGRLPLHRQGQDAASSTAST